MSSSSGSESGSSSGSFDVLEAEVEEKEEEEEEEEQQSSTTPLPSSSTDTSSAMPPSPLPRPLGSALPSYMLLHLDFGPPSAADKERLQRKETELREMAPRVLAFGTPPSLSLKRPREQQAADLAHTLVEEAAEKRRRLTLGLSMIRADGTVIHV